jgi:hypothetical protein
LDAVALEEAGWREHRMSEMLASISLVVAKAHTNEYLLTRREAEVASLSALCGSS